MSNTIYSSNLICMFFRKIIRFYKVYGLLTMLSAIYSRIWKIIVPPRRAFFYIDLCKINKSSKLFSHNLSVEPYRNISEMPQCVISHLTESGTVYNRKIRHKEILLDFLKRFFKRNGIFWLATCDNNTVGYQWSLIAKNNDMFHFVPLDYKDAIIAGVEVFPDFRGKGINREITEMVLLQLKRYGISNFYLDIEISNKPSMRSFSNTSFTRLGTARIIKVFGKYIVIWDKKTEVAN